MPYSAGKGKTLLIASGIHRDPDRKHLFITLTNSCPDGNHLLVPVCSVVPGRHYDPACEIAPGEHEFIKKASYVEYRYAGTRHTGHITKCVDGWEFQQKASISQDLLDRVFEGVENSDFIPKWAHDYFQLWRDR